VVQHEREELMQEDNEFIHEHNEMQSDHEQSSLYLVLFMIEHKGVLLYFSVFMRYSDEFMQYHDGLKFYRDPITIEYGKII
jgi:hypothetical protein